MFFFSSLLHFLSFSISRCSCCLHTTSQQHQFLFRHKVQGFSVVSRLSIPPMKLNSGHQFDPEPQVASHCVSHTIEVYESFQVRRESICYMIGQKIGDNSKTYLEREISIYECVLCTNVICSDFRGRK